LSRRWLVRAAIATGITFAFVYLYAPPHYVAEQFAIRPDRISAESGVVSFVTGVLCGFFALSLWFALLSVLVAPIGMAAGSIALRKETTNGEGHSLLNLAGLVLNLVALGFVLSQVISATIWR
jgi:hypothetical protein